MDFPFIGELLDYWTEYPPSHLLLRAIAQFESKEDHGDRRQQKADEIGDTTYVAPPSSTKHPHKTPPRRKIPPAPSSTEIYEAQRDMSGRSGARHLDCAPPHIQQAVERFKKGLHLDVPDTKN